MIFSRSRARYDPDERFRRPGLRLLGVLSLVIIAVFLSLTVSIYREAFSTDAAVTLRTDHVGNQLQEQADVRMRGLVIGKVRRVAGRGDFAELELAMDPEQIHRVPRNVSARLLPKTLFGERFVSLVEPAQPDPTALADGDVISQDSSATAIELERVLNNLLSLLQSVEPARLASTLNALSQALEGRGKPLGETLVQVGNYIGALNPQLPEIKDDITRFADVANTYDSAAGDFLGALSDLTVTSRTVLEQRNNLELLYRQLTTAATDVTAFVSKNSSTIITLADSSRPTLELLARYAPQYACMLAAVTNLKPRLEKVFGKGGEPGLRVNLRFVEDRGWYKPGVDDPRYTDKFGPRCYDTAASPAALVGLDDGLGPANSPQEQDFLAALTAPELGVEPSEVPDWSGLLIGPLLRGTQVELR